MVLLNIQQLAKLNLFHVECLQTEIFQMLQQIPLTEDLVS